MRRVDDPGEPVVRCAGEQQSAVRRNPRPVRETLRPDRFGPHREIAAAIEQVKPPEAAAEAEEANQQSTNLTVHITPLGNGAAPVKMQVDTMAINES